jgi:FkbM family methyltransferase
VGANVGDRTAIFVGLGARVVAVEPQAACIEQLQGRFGDAVRIVPAAVGARPGREELLVANYSTLSTLSRQWTEAVTESGRFTDFSWSERIPVDVTTLDALIDRFGSPDFCKIDVEGYEHEVVRGLSRPIAALSFEFTPELLDSRLECVEHLTRLGMSRFNFSVGETLRLSFRRWMDAAALREFLRSAPRDGVFFGDVYATAPRRRLPRRKA